MPKPITVFEHQNLHNGEQGFDDKAHQALEKFRGSGDDFPYYTLISKGVRFKSWVGVIQVGDLQIEVLPKTDRGAEDETAQTKWRNILIGMLIAVGDLDAKAPSSSALQLHANSILELYFAIYLKEIEYLLHRGLVKKYRKVEGNVGALKGALVFGKHIQQNITHQERFYTRHTVYDREHKLHQILYKALCAVGRLNHSPKLKGKVAEIQLHFPEMQDLKVSAETFTHIVLDRKTQSYKTALDIAKLILLHYHPDIRNGKNDVLALMFDMNSLWERFVFASLRKYSLGNWTVREQVYKGFWGSDSGNVGMKPDILIESEGQKFVLDTKWKNIGDSNPSPVDLRQLYAYHAYFGARKVALVYPDKPDKPDKSVKHFKGWFIDIDGDGSAGKGETHTTKECSVIKIAVPDGSDEKQNIKAWQQKIGEGILGWLQPSIESK